MPSPVSNVVSIVANSGALTLWVTREDGTRAQYAVSTDHVNHRRIAERLKAKNFEEIEELINPTVRLENAKARIVETISSAKLPNSLVGTAELRDGQVYVNHVPVHNVVTDRVVGLALGGYPIDAALRFLELVLMNPSSRSQEELYDFLANRHLPLTEDGCFLAYRRVTSDYLDFYTRTVDNSIGKVVECEREAVDPDRTKECSYGYHVGALEYVRHYHGGKGRVVVVKVSPTDCVSVPKDYNHQKMRVCRYEVLYELDTGDQVALDRPIYSTNGREYQNSDGWLDESDVEDSDVDEYWKDGWDADYEDWSTERLAYECLVRDLTSTRQEGRDLGDSRMIELLIDSDEDGFTDLDDESCDDCECVQCDDEDLFLDSYGSVAVSVPAPTAPVVSIAEALKGRPNGDEYWKFARAVGPARGFPDKVGMEVLVQSVDETYGTVSYFPSLSGTARLGGMVLADFLDCFDRSES